MTDAPATPAAPPQIDLRAGADADANARMLTLIVYGLYLGGLLTGGLTTLAGVIIAYIARGTAPEWAKSHYTFQIWTFWIGLAACLALGAWFVMSALLAIILIGIPLLFLGGVLAVGLAIWFVVRCAMGLNYASQTQAYPRPTALLA